MREGEEGASALMGMEEFVERSDRKATNELNERPGSDGGEGRQAGKG